MLTEKEKQTLLKLLDSVQISGNRAQVRKAMEELDALTKKVEALPTEETPEKKKKTA